MIVTGGCRCARSRYAYTGEIGPANYCQCSDCRKIAGGPFNIGVRLDRESFHIVLAPVKGLTMRGGSGIELTRHFRADCG